MAEIKNNFLQSKMNKDLDDRLIPDGQYRDALNIEIGKSDQDDIGALQNSLGNYKLPLPEEGEDMTCIGFFMDSQNNRIYRFLTNYLDPDPSNIILPEPGEGYEMRITVFDFNTQAYTVLVEGLFLNFATNKEFLIIGVNLIEGLLFWVDNRNQPRKINVLNASNPNYYTTEEQISIAKYAPVEAITLYKKVTATVVDASLGSIIVLAGNISIVPGMTVISEAISGADYIIVVDVNIDTLLNTTTITLYEEPTVTIEDGEQLTFLISTMSDKSSVPSWPGDPAFLEDKYVRFSYRFKYDDNEYSLMAPFTQIAYIPKQKGFFIAGNETDAYRSTIINWFENNINNIELVIPLPDKIGNLTSSYKIEEIDILYKESDSLAIKVFETLSISSMNTSANSNNNYYIQPYQSQKPYKTLPESQNTRVYDKVPVRASAQESSGNRIIYGNYYDKYTCPSSINYNISVQPKSPIGTNFIEYPNHTLKKNRNYQVGFVIADKFGRQSPVILSSVDLLGAVVGGVYTKGSTVYSSYENSVLFEDVRTWFGDTLILYLNSPIDQQRDISAGMPGLYAIPTSNSGFAITALVETTPNEYTFTLDLTALTSNYVPEVGNILRGKYVDYVRVLTSIITYETPGNPLTPIVSVTITTSGSIGDIYTYNNPGGDIADIKFSYIYNPIGWYSYKIVVKQQEQDYYNVYLPGMLNGYPKGQTYGSQVTYTGGVASLQTGINTTQFPVSETGNTAHIVLINDNINKVPRDLSEVGPDQKQYRSSVQLYGRVENTENSLIIVGDDPLYSAKVTKIFYDTATVGNEDWGLINPGDGIQCLEANLPIPDTTPPATSGATMPNPYRWLGDTVVVSNVVSGTNGTITLSAPNWIIDTGSPSTTYKTFRITRAENKQYFPTRKADTVISIATGNEFNFLDNSADNLSGTAALNFYQLQNSPLIGRVSTVNKIGVLAADMIPFLSVYETKPEQTILELFWETTTSGLLSDLNSDVLTGFDGPSSFGDVNYIHFENQDPYGVGEGTGEPNSKWITDAFAVLNQNGIILPNTTVTLLSVFDGTGQNRLDDFGLESITAGLEATYRLYIKEPGAPANAGDFVFNNNAGSLESYTFTFNIVDLDNPSTATNLIINGRLGNNNPIIITEVVDYAITQASTNIVTLVAKNGSYSNATTGLKWSIIGGDTIIPSFNIEPYSGLLTLVNNQIPLGIYELEIKVQDAVNTTNGDVLLPENTDFGTLFSTITLTINVGDEPVPYWLRPLFGPSTFVYGGTQCNQQIYPYGMIYIGQRTNFGVGYSYLPEIPLSGRNYQVVKNVEIVNAISQGVPSPGISGLTTGSYRIKMSLYVPLPPACNPSSFFVTTVASFSIYLYRRVYNPANISGSGWVLVETQNNTLDNPPLGPNYTSPILTVSTGQDEKLITTSFTIEADPVIPYEWAVGVKVIRGATSSNDKGTGSFVYFEGEDANYSYDQITPNFSEPLLLPYTYYTGVENVDGSTSAIPYATLDAKKGLSYTSTGNIIASGAINTGDLIVNLTLSTANPQATPGLKATIIKSGITVGLGTVVDVNIANPAQITIQLNPTPTYPAVPSLAGGELQLRTEIGNEDVGALYANTAEGTELKRFYTDAGFTQKWIPPFADKFYVFQTIKNYAPNKPTKFSEYPYYCARFNSSGEVIEQIPYVPNSQTAWKGGTSPTTDFFNYGYNIYYEEPPLP